MTIHEKYMLRCLQLAKLGAGNVAPNPMVGAVLVNGARIIGEGYHHRLGGPHAEPNCLASVKQEDRHLIGQSVMYVSLEPCVHFGKTPPCADLIIDNKIPKVVIGCRDPFRQVNGKGIEKLRAAGIEVEQNILKEPCEELNKRFFVFHTEHRPYIILKWAQTSNGKIAATHTTGPGRLFITNEQTNRLVHRWRSEESAILIGTKTALMDDPQLTVRLWPGHNPIRLVIDMELKLPSSLKIFSHDARTIVFNKVKHETKDNVAFYQVTDDVSLVHQVSNALYGLKIQSVIVEGGAQLIQSFIEEGIWDEARIITNRQLAIGDGLSSPVLNKCVKMNEQNILSDVIEFYKPIRPQPGT
ncbi:MAG TPA: bifunctional diaminohydroxyphosphoribosylaminopyrimidine deaminase/5-amino-6-(5-phosphoribosylamino)uracil reductase RibD [Chitinophagaceae bacterium]|nr:bifunctional diaminohydroxyphosphoribosylaminopyrimidine deaminase/5-amino-6-(5-phosphoribosylamino)uracil reductase RibD [Chitinophagaceae bacterium]